MLHLVLSKRARVLKAFVGQAGQGVEVFNCSCSTVGVGGNQAVRYGSTPTGEYSIGSPIWSRPDESNEIHEAYGPVFVPLTGGSVSDRSGFGIHGGGTGLGVAAWTSLYQPGLQPTHGCVRVYNQAAVRLAGLVEGLLAAGHVCKLTVVQ